MTKRVPDHVGGDERTLDRLHRAHGFDGGPGGAGGGGGATGDGGAAGPPPSGWIAQFCSQRSSPEPAMLRQLTVTFCPGRNGFASATAASARSTPSGESGLEVFRRRSVLP